jgi:CDP-diacylglycerol--glycerol-3-phosphate 3-phosphatidyltransferase
MNVQKTLDKVIDKVFLRFIPRSVKPNHVTIIRFILIPFVYELLATRQFGWALIVFIVAALTDAIDGAMARTRNQITDVGKVIDPLADKLLILSVLVFIGYRNLVVEVFAIFILMEIIAVIAGYFLSFAVGKPIGANVFGKIKLVLQCVCVGLFILGIILHNRAMVNDSKYLLFGALFVAVVSALEQGRRKLMQMKENGFFEFQTR